MALLSYRRHRFPPEIIPEEAQSKVSSFSSSSPMVVGATIPMGYRTLRLPIVPKAYSHSSFLS
jgi:hypothetical protein